MEHMKSDNTSSLEESLFCYVDPQEEVNRLLHIGIDYAQKGYLAFTRSYLIKAREHAARCGFEIPQIKLEQIEQTACRVLSRSFLEKAKKYSEIGYDNLTRHYLDTGREYASIGKYEIPDNEIQTIMGNISDKKINARRRTAYDRRIDSEAFGTSLERAERHYHDGDIDKARFWLVVAESDGHRVRSKKLHRRLTTLKSSIEAYSS